MAYKIKLGAFSKLENSTAQPTVTLWAEYDINLKEGCDISNPEITLSIDWATVSGYNYAKLLDRYYWIVGKNMLRESLCVLQLKVDVLATYKSEIGATSLYVLRSAYAYDPYIRDNFYPMTGRVTQYHQTQTTGIPGDFGSGIYVLNVAGTNTSGANTLYQFSPAEFRTLFQNLYTTINGFQLSDVIATVVQLFGGNPQSLINSAMWFPSAFSTGTPETITIGAWNSGASGIPLTSAIYDFSSYTFSLYKHPQAATRGDYLNLAPYSQYNIGLPGIGVIALDTSKLIGETSITIKRTMDAISGQLVCDIVGTSSAQILAHLKGQIGIPISLRGAGNTSLPASGISSLGTAAVAAATGGAAAIAGAVTSGIGTVLDAVGGAPVNTGVGSGAADIMNKAAWLDSTFYKVTDGDNTEHGKPLCTNFQISSLPGYNVVSEGNVPIAGPLPEQQEVKRFLESGFFYE